MAEGKTQASDASVESYLSAVEDPSRRSDCEVLSRLMAKATRQPARMWGTGIVGFGSHHYKYESGREGDTCLVGFASRSSDISIYGIAAAPDRETLLASLGKHKMGKGCLYIKKIGDIDLTVLEQLIRSSVAALK